MIFAVLSKNKYYSSKLTTTVYNFGYADFSFNISIENYKTRKPPP